MSLDIKRWFGLILTLLIVAFSFTPSFQALTSFPKEIRIFQSAVKQFKLALPLSVTVSSNQPEIVEINGHKDSFETSLNNPITFKPSKIGKSSVELKLFGVIPFKKVDVNVLKDIKVIPGGQTIGVKLKSAGVMVVGEYSIQTEDGKTISPAELAGIRIGDILLKMNGKFLSSVDDVSKLLNQLATEKKSIELELQRAKERIKVKINPVFDTKSQAYRLGLYIRDSAAGVGTLTFYDPKTNKYGALGHVITDMDTQEPIVVREGKILYSDVTSIEKGKNGKPGEKRAIFVDENNVIGNITKNTPFGIFGVLNQKPLHGLINEPISIALPEDVKEGPAEILTVIEDQKVERFKIEITKVVQQKYPATKGMVIKVTDKKLLDKTGGIIQGMSGSPIIQNGKLVGAVTHVFVNDPTSGYGSFIEWMIRDAEISETRLKAS
ncbi:SpoIVB peptidase [Tepidibacillus fermentans]|uniref:Stage IV sporulation protein B n=1 Tax=Tepidibacillus fermentans TaxID=1281767 RepID=A0A4R3KK98_9BACI|nr:SpoIVB peptidase [Tepidibacillus fermentans]TCS84047.1 stage IV sporulation protein B [Tepidibacillus fermentans]